MNNLQNHTTSLKLSKRLKELGFPQKSLFYWSKYKKEGQYQLKFSEKHNVYGISAYLTSELGEWLPKGRVGFSDGMNGEIYEDDLDTECFELTVSFSHVNKKWLVYYEGFDFNIRLDKTCESKNLSDALAKMLIYLAEQEIINPKAL